MAVTFDPRTGVPSWTSDTDEVTRTQFQTAMVAIAASMALRDQGVAAARPAAGKAGRFWLSTDTGILELDDGVQWRVVGSRTRGQTVVPPTAAEVALTVQGLASQSGALQAWLDQAGGILASVSAAGLLTAHRATFTGGTGAGTVLTATGTDPAQIVASVKGAAGQTADLHRWMNNGGSVIARVTAGGGIGAAGDLVSSALVRSSGVVADGDITSTGRVTADTVRVSGDLAAPNVTGSATSPVSLHAYRVKNDTANLPDNVLTILAGLTAETGTGALNYNNGVWTIPVKGRYRVSASCSFAANPDGARGVYILRNDVIIDQVRIPTGSNNYATIGLETSAVFNVGDTLSIGVQQNSGGTLAAGKIGTPPARITIDWIGAAA